jgi:hypothetical protein
MGTFLGLDRLRGREMVKNQDSCRRIPVVVGFMSCEWTLRDHPLLWIANPAQG